MTYFKLDIPKINRSIANMKSISSSIKSDIRDVYSSLKNVDSAWFGLDCDAFFNRIKKDNFSINEYFVELNDYLNKVNNFNNSIDSICSRFGYRKNSVQLKYDNQKISLCEEKLKNVLNYLNRAQQYANSFEYIPGFTEMAKVRQLCSSISNMKKSVNTILNKLEQFTSSIDKVLQNSQFELSKYNIELQLKPMHYTWKESSVNVSSLETKVMEESKVNNSQIIFDNSKNSNNDIDIEVFTLDSNNEISISVDDVKKIVINEAKSNMEKIQTNFVDNDFNFSIENNKTNNSDVDINNFVDDIEVLDIDVFKINDNNRIDVDKFK